MKAKALLSLILLFCCTQLGASPPASACSMGGLPVCSATLSGDTWNEYDISISLFSRCK